ncbi:hypothetical protein MCC93_23940 [Morococcus cerebrosus]|uniref:Uncharacterized protein n=1 Tax=Morococcus cerebrosus TaxID=1056807 RepID=A0A0C1GHN2_9NEIS|nr:hypothetical protein MCC93_23940 [Morococcus cerebrosus]
MKAVLSFSGRVVFDKGRLKAGFQTTFIIGIPAENDGTSPFSSATKAD